MSRLMHAPRGRPAAGLSLRTQVAWLACVAVGLALLLLVISAPLVGLLLLVASVAVGLAYRSPAIPIGVWGASILIALLAQGKLPKGGTVTLYAGWTLLGVGLVLARRGADRRRLSAVFGTPLAASLLLVAWLAVRLPSSTAPDYGSQKVQLTLVTCIVPLIALTLVGGSHRDATLYFRILVWMGVATALYDVYLILTGKAASANANRYTIGSGVDPIGLARSLGELLLILLYAFARSRGRLARVALAGALVVVVVAMLGSGSRGPISALIVAIPLLLVTRVRDGRTFRRLLLLLLVGGAIGAVGVAAFVPSRTYSRALSVFSGEDNESGEVPRSFLWKTAFDAEPNTATGVLFGIGTGSYAVLRPVERYPHNVGIELLLETGLVGLSLFAVVVVSGIRRISGLAFRRGGAGGLAGLVLSLIVFSLVNSMFSGDIAGNSSLFGWIGLGVGLVAADRARAAAVAPRSSPGVLTTPAPA